MRLSRMPLGQDLPGGCSEVVGQGCGHLKAQRRLRDPLQVQSHGCRQAPEDSLVSSPWDLATGLLACPERLIRETAFKAEATIFLYRSLRSDMPLYLPYSVHSK